MKRHHARDRGMALLIALAVVVLIAAIVAAAIGWTKNDRLNAGKAIHNLGVQDLTESTLQFGRSFFAARDHNRSLRRHDPFLLASSYGAVYGMLRQNGQRLYAIDSVDGSEYLFDMTGAPNSVPVTASIAASNRRLIAEQLNALATTLGYER